jgi:hypothetical protein
MKVEEVELATTQQFKIKRNRKQRRLGMPDRRGLSLEDLQELLARAERGELADEIKPRFISAEIRERPDGLHALYMRLTVDD